MATNSVPRTWSVGETVTAAQMNTEVRDPLTGIQSAWTAYTPAITGYTTATFTLSGCAYQRYGKTALVRAQFALATVTTLGAATISVALPFPASSTPPSLGQSGTVQYRTNAGVHVAGLVSIAASATTATILVATPGGATPNLMRLSGANPAGQVVGDTFTLAWCYETA